MPCCCIIVGLSEQEQLLIFLCLGPSLHHGLLPNQPHLFKMVLIKCPNKLNLNNLLLLSETTAQEVHQDGVEPEVVIKGKSSVNSEVPPKPPTNFGKLSGHVIIVYVLSKV